jgi:CheY-like chemotaxis protein
MPAPDGFALAQSIKEHPKHGATPVILMTSADRLGDGSRCAEIGIDAHLVKPVRQSVLLDRIRQSVRPIVSSADVNDRTVSDLPNVPATRSLNILLAEDNLVNQKLAVKLLTKRGHRVTVVGNGQEALKSLQTSTFDIVLMDVQMPVLDGLSATRQIRKAEGSRNRTPIIAMTAHAMTGNREKCLEAGMDDYVSKPINPRLLFDTIESLLSTSTTVTTQLTDSHSADDLAVDFADLLDRVDGDREFLNEILDAFRSESHNLLREAKTAVAAQDFSIVRQNAHAIRGAAANLSGTATVKAAQALEDAGIDADIPGTLQAISSVENQIERLQATLESLLTS